MTLTRPQWFAYWYPAYYAEPVGFVTLRVSCVLNGQEYSLESPYHALPSPRPVGEVFAGIELHGDDPPKLPTVFSEGTAGFEAIKVAVDDIAFNAARDLLRAKFYDLMFQNILKCLTPST